MKVARLALAATALLAAAACGSAALTEPHGPGLDGPRGNVGQFGSGAISSDPPVPLTPYTASRTAD
jgi:hypothetical protein